MATTKKKTPALDFTTHDFLTHSRNFTILVEDSNGDHDVMVVRLTHKKESAFNLNPIFLKASKAYEKDDGSLTREDCIEAALVKAGFTVEWPLGAYTTE